MNKMESTIMKRCLVLSLMMPLMAAAINSGVQKVDGIPTLEINGKSVPPFILYHVVGGRPVYKPVIKAADPSAELLKMSRKYENISLNTLPLQLPCIEWSKDGSPVDYSRYDKQIEETLKINPEAKLILRVIIKAPEWWKEKYPDHLVKFQNGKGVYGCPASEQWRKDAFGMLRSFIRHIEEKFSDNVIGYHPGGQSAMEWLYERCWDQRNPVITGFSEPFRQGFARWIQKKYGTVSALSKAWGRPVQSFASIQVPSFEQQSTGMVGMFRDPAKQRFEIDFAEYMQVCMCEVVEECGKIVREETNGKKLSLAFYGYQFSASDHSMGPTASGHLKLNRLLKSPYIDIISSPYSYIDRNAGDSGSQQVAIDSIQIHGKLFAMEDDTRSHTAPYASFGRTADMRETLGVFRRNFSVQLQHRSARWWMDFGCGSNALPEIVENFSREIDIWESLPVRKFSPETAIIIDEESPLYMRLSNEVSKTSVSRQMKYINRMGCSVGLYTLEDVCRGLLPAETKFFVFLNSYKIDQKNRKALHDVLKKHNGTALWYYAPGFICDDTISKANIADLTGIKVKDAGKRTNASMLSLTEQSYIPTRHSFGSQTMPDPLLAVAGGQTDVISLATYKDSQDISMAVKKNQGWTSVLYTGLYLDASVLRRLASKAGVHIYCSNDEVVRATEDFISIHAVRDGQKVLNFPYEVTLTDLFNGEKFSNPSTKHSFNMQKGSTRIFRIYKN